MFQVTLILQRQSSNGSFKYLLDRDTIQDADIELLRMPKPLN